MTERWDCIFVDRIEGRRIYLTKPQKYGCMYENVKRDSSEEIKVRKTIPKECGIIKGLSNENKVLCATAIAVAYNRNKLKSSNGLIVRGFKGRTPFPGLQTALIETQGMNLRKKGTTGWLTYISPNEEFYYIRDAKSRGEKLLPELAEKINSCIEYIMNGWKE